MIIDPSILVGPVPRTERGHSARVHESGNLVAYANNCSAVVVWVDGSGSRMFARHSVRVRVARLDPSGNYLATGDERGRVRIWAVLADDGDPLKPKFEYDVLAGDINDLDWSVDGERIAVGGKGRDRFGHVFMVSTGSTVGEIMGMSRPINCVSFKPTRPFKIATGSEDGLVCVFAGPPFKLLKRVDVNCGFVNAVQYNQSGSKLACSGSSGEVHIIDDKSLEICCVLKRVDKSPSILGLCWCRDLVDNLVTVDSGRMLRMWDSTKQGQEALLSELSIGDRIEDQQVGCCSISGGRIVSVSLSGRLNLIGTENGGLVQTQIIEGHSKMISAMSFVEDTLISISPDGHLLISRSLSSPTTQSFDEFRLMDEKLYSTISVDSRNCQNKCWLALNSELIQLDTQTMTSRKVLTTENPIQSIASLSENLCVSLMADRVLGVRTEKNGVCTFESHRFSNPLTALSAVSEEAGGEVIVGDENGSIHLLAISQNAFVTTETIRGSSSDGAVVELAAQSSENGLLAAAAYSSHLIKCWRNGKNLSEDRWHHHAAKISGLAWSTDGKLLASAGIDAHVFVYDPENTRIPLRKIYNAHVNSPVTALEWIGPNRLCSGGMDAAVKVWEV